jgi:hypothetical protein
MINTLARPWLERVLLVISVGSILVPFYILVLQWRAFRYIYAVDLGLKFFVLIASSLCLLWSSTVLAMLAIESRACSHY